MLVHGLVGSLDYFDPAARLRSDSVHALDLLGYGFHMQLDAGALTLSRQVDHVAAQIECCAAPPVWLLGHSMGGAIVMLLADRRPDLVRGIINVEGNFTRKDAFWSSRIMDMSAADWADEYDRMKTDVGDWLTRCNVAPTPQRISWANRILDHQPPETVRAMSRTLVEETSRPDYLAAVRRVIAHGIELHLIAGETSAANWDVPEFVKRAAASDATVEDAGHMMMLEAPAAFCETVERIVRKSG